MATELATRNHLAARRIAPTHANHASLVKRVCHHSVTFLLGRALRNALKQA
jgi:hypothetical protein